MKYIFLLIFTCFFAIGTIHAFEQKPAAGAVAVRTIRKDSANVNFHRISDQELDRLRSQKAFNYKELPPAELSLWDRFWLWFWDKVNRVLSYGASNPVARWIFYITLAAILVYVVWWLSRSNSIFMRGSSKNTLDYNVLSDNIHEINYEQEIEEMASQGKYRLATRLLYLRTLKQLSDKQIISWHPNKTNHAYLKEVNKEQLAQPFRLLTQRFDYIWYGNFPVDEEIFKPLRQSFDDFSTTIK